MASSMQDGGLSNYHLAWSLPLYSKPTRFGTVTSMISARIMVHKTVNISEAKTHFLELLRRVMMGERVVIAKAGTPVAVLSPIDDVPARRTPGLDAGKVIIAPDFDDSLSEFEL